MVEAPGSGDAEIDAEIDALIAQRNELRAQRDFAGGRCHPRRARRARDRARGHRPGHHLVPRMTRRPPLAEQATAWSAESVRHRRRAGRGRPRGERVADRRAAARAQRLDRRRPRRQRTPARSSNGSRPRTACAFATSIGPGSRPRRARTRRRACSPAPSRWSRPTSTSCSADPAAFLVALDGVTDPGNLGAVLRVAGTAGATGVVVPRHRAALAHPGGGEGRGRRGRARPGRPGGRDPRGARAGRSAPRSGRWASTPRGPRRCSTSPSPTAR